MDKKRVISDISLLAVTFFWGISYYFADRCLEELGPFTLISARFLVGFLAAFLIAFKRCVKASRETVKYAAILGIVLYLVYVFCTIGQMYTSLSNAGFLCTLAGIITPVMLFIFKKQKPDKKLAFVMPLTLIGVGLMTLSASFTLAFGDILCLACSFAYSLHIIIMEKAVKSDKVDAFALGILQLGFTGLYGIPAALIFEKPALPQNGETYIFFALLTVFASGLAFIVQAVAQKHTSATVVGFIFAAEPIFAGVSAYLFAGEVLSWRSYLGMAFIMAAIVFSEVDIGARKKAALDSPQQE